MSEYKINGLIPAIVQDWQSKQVLMLAYVNQKSYEYMLNNGETCFWSRSRNQLWHKGETSGNIQKIKNMLFDCDGDSLLIEVEQIGTGACHTGQYSCFGAFKIEHSIVEQIFKEIKDRFQNPIENSYTNYLLKEGIDKICKKIGEEATEVVIAAKNHQKYDLIGEICDLLYHVLVLMKISNLTPEEIDSELANRHNIKGNLKTFNNKGEF